MSEKRTIVHILLYDLRTDHLVFPADLDPFSASPFRSKIDVSYHKAHNY